MFSKIGFLVEKLLNCGGGVTEIPKTLFIITIYVQFQFLLPVCP